MLSYSYSERIWKLPGRRLGQKGPEEKAEPFYLSEKWKEEWATEPEVGRVADGVPFRVDRIRGLGNAVVPLQAREAFRRLIGL
jgi:DNA (cytosine-5)-methyltransferase 1